MSRKYKFHDQDKLHFVTFATVNWIDVFTRIIYKDIVVESLKYCIIHKGLELYAWCIMSNHVHLIIGTQKMTMQDILRDMKKHTSKAIIKSIAENPQESRKDWMLWMFERAGSRNPNNQKFQFWQQHNKPIELWNNEIMQQKLDYIHYNPAEAGFVAEPEHYTYSSAIDYAGGKGMIDIIFIE